jgi:hypothetical protein
MKRYIFILILFAFFAGVDQTQAQAQCNPDEQIEKCVPKLLDGFNFIKSYKVDGEGGAKQKVEYSYVFAKGLQYNLNLCVPAATIKGVRMTLYDSNRKPVSSNFMDGKYYDKIIYPCGATGIYYITFTFEEGADAYCGGAVLGFKK